MEKIYDVFSTLIFVAFYILNFGGKYVIFYFFGNLKYLERKKKSRNFFLALRWREMA